MSNKNNGDIKVVIVAADDKKGLSGLAAYSLGRCPYYCVIRLHDDHVVDVSIEENPDQYDHVPGSIPDMLSEKGANVVLVGGNVESITMPCPKAIERFKAHKIEVAIGQAKSIAELFGLYNAGKLRTVLSPK